MNEYFDITQSRCTGKRMTGWEQDEPVHRGHGTRGQQRH